MKTETKILGTILIFTAVILFGGIFLLSRQSTSTGSTGLLSDKVLEIDYTKGQKIGTDSAKIKLVEFSDFQCPACAAVEPYLKNIRANYPTEVVFIYRHFPLPQHNWARPAAYVAEAAGQQGKFWEMHDKLFETQEQWIGLSDGKEFFLKLAKDLNLNEENVRKILDENVYKSKIDKDIAEGQRLGVSSTPTFYLNGRKLNFKTWSDIELTVAEELKK